MSSHFAGILATEVVDGIPYALLFNVRTLSSLDLQERIPSLEELLQIVQEILTKIPGGSNKDHREEIDPVETAKREFFEETGLRVKEGIIPQEVWSEISTGYFLQAFYHVSLRDCEGELRKKGIRDGNQVLSAPIRVRMDDAVHLICRTHFVPLVELSNALSKSLVG